MEKINLFYATDNKNKLHNMYYRLKDYPIKIVSPADLKINLEVEENGNTVEENALLKATAYYKIVNMPTIAGDSGMYIEGIDKEKALSFQCFWGSPFFELLKAQFAQNSRVLCFFYA